MSNKESTFSGSFFGFAWVNIVYFASTFLTANILMPFGLCYREKWLAKHTVIEGKQLEFYGNAVVLFIKKRLFAIVAPVLLGIAAALLLTGDSIQEFGYVAEGFRVAIIVLAFTVYFLYTVWLARRMRKWIIKHTRFCEVKSKK